MNAARKFGFENAVSDVEKIFNSQEINTVFIATRHNTHAEMVIGALHAGKHVFVEKPLALTSEELDKVSKALNENGALLFVGFNRRFSKAAMTVSRYFEGLSEPKLLNFRINAGEIASDHWIQQEEIGGGRIVGEICHFIDLMQFFTKADPVVVYAESLPGIGSKKKNDDNLAISIRFSDGSVGTLSYVSNGGKALPKEYLEISAGGKTAVINDFKTVSMFGETRSKVVKTPGKGHEEEISTFIDAVRGSLPSPLSFDSIYLTTRTTFKIKESLRTGKPVSILKK